MSAARALYVRTSGWPGSAALASVMSAGVGQVALFVSGVAAARILGPTDRGTLATVALVIGIAVSVGSLGVPLALTYGLARQPDAARSLTRWALRVFFAQGLLLVPFAGVAIASFSRREDILPTILLGATVAPAILAQMYGLAILQGRLQFAQMNMARVAPAGLYAALASILLISGIGSLASLTAMFLAANLIAAIVIWLPSLRMTGGKDAVAGRPLIGFGVRAWLGSISPMDTFRFDQIVVVVLFPQAVVGTYVVALAFSNLPRLIGLSVGLIAYPRVAAMGPGNERRRATFGHTLMTMILAAPVVVVISLAASPIIALLFGDAYVSSAALVGPLVAAGWLAGSRRTMNEAARGAGLTSAGSVAEIAAWIGFALTVAIATPTMHELGIALAMLVGSAAGFLALLSLVLRGPWDRSDHQFLAEETP